MDTNPTHDELIAEIKRLEETSRHYRRAEKINRALFKIASAVSSAPDLNALYRSIHASLGAVTDATNFYIALYDVASDGVSFPYCVDEADGSYLPRLGISRTASLTGDVIRQRRPLMLTRSEILAWRAQSNLSVPSCSPSEIWLGVPLMVQQEVIGVMAVQSYSNPQCYDRTDMDIMVAVADQVALAIESKRASEALRESELRFREMAELLPETIFEIDSEGTVLFVNRNGLKQFDYAPQDLEKGLSIYDMLTSEDLEQAGANFARVLAGESSGLSEYTGQRKNGTTFPIMLLSAPIVRDETPVGLRGFIIDLTEKKQLEHKLLHAQKMEAIGTLVGGIAHDFNNILAAILGFSEMALMDAPGDSPVSDNLRQVVKAGYRAKDLVEQILSFSRQKNLRKRAIRISPIVREAVKSMRATLPSTITIDTDIAEDVGVVDADSTQIQQVVMNLCTNAGRAMDGRGGTLRIGLKELAVSTDEKHGVPELNPGPYLVLTVSDTGAGVPQDIRQRIFEPYFTTRFDGIGTGMELAVVHGIVKRHGGVITLESDGTSGSTFRVYLPVIRSALPVRDEQDTAAPTGTESILLIDDEKLLTDMGTQMLERLGYRVDATNSSVEALERFKRQPMDYDLVITDMTMPHITGDNLARELMAARPDIPIILCTGFNESITPSISASIGIRAFLMKPLKLHALAATIRQVLDA